MPNDSQGPIQIFDTSVASLNLAFAQILERLDQALGLRGITAIYDATSVGGPQRQDDAVRLMDLPSERPSNPLYYLLAPRPSTVGQASSPTALVDNTGGVVSGTLAALGGTTPLTDNSGGTADDTIAAITTGGAAADRAPTRDAIADLAAKVNALIADLVTVRDAVSSLASQLVAVQTALISAGVLL